MKTNSSTKLTAAEIGSLWTSYVNDNLAICMLKYFLNMIEDKNAKLVTQFAYDLSQKHIKRITQFFNESNITVPKGFTDDDVNVNAPRLYSDIMVMFYIFNMAKLGLSAYTLALNHSARSDIIDYFSDCIGESVKLYRKLTSSMLEKGVYIRSPIVTVTKERDYIEKQSFLKGFFTEPRSLLTVEILHIHSNILSNIIGRPLLTGFAQTAKSRRVHEYMIKGKDIASKHIKQFSSILKDEEISVSLTSDITVTNSTEPPFSDRLMMFHTTLLISSSISGYSTGLSSSLRRDLQANYIRFLTEISQYASDGAKIMIDNAWLEQPPQAVRHKQLVGV